MDLERDKLKHIVVGLKKGDNQSRKHLFEMFSSRMMAVCFRYLGNKEDAEDVLMDSFIKIFENIGMYKEDNFVAWMTRVFTNQCLMFLRSKNRLILRQNDYIKTQDEVVDFPSDCRFSSRDLLRAMEVLPKSLRTIFNMYVVDGYSSDNICKELSITKNSFYSSIYKAKTMLKKELMKIEANRG